MRHSAEEPLILSVVLLSAAILSVVERNSNWETINNPPSETITSSANQCTGGVNDIYKKNVFKSNFKLASGGSTVVEHLPRHPEVKGLSPTTAPGNGREK
jgi:hypothetical protein